MVAEFGFHRTVGLQQRAAKYRLIEWTHHRTLLKFPKIAAISPGGALRIALCQMIKADATLQFCQDLLGQFLFFYQDVQG